MYGALEWLGASMLGSSPAMQPGAIDIVAVRRSSSKSQGESFLVCSPWHVRAPGGGGGGSGRRDIKVIINGTDSGLRMKVGPAGEAFFIERIEDGLGRGALEGSSLSSRQGIGALTPPLTSTPSFKSKRMRSFSEGFLEDGSTAMPAVAEGAALTGVGAAPETAAGSDNTAPPSSSGGCEEAEVAAPTVWRRTKSFESLPSAGAGEGEGGASAEWLWAWGEIPVPAESTEGVAAPDQLIGTTDSDECQGESRRLAAQGSANHVAFSEDLWGAATVTTTQAEVDPEDISPEPPVGALYDSDTDSYHSLSVAAEEESPRARVFRYRKSLVPPRSQLQTLALGALRDGENDLVFEVEGAAPLKARLFVWSERTRVLVADVEGVVTRGVPAGWSGLLSSAGSGAINDEAAELLRRVRLGGYCVLYLSSSRIVPRNQLERLPAGPVLCPPGALLRAFGELPEVFKAAALRGITSMFPPGHSPFHAGLCTQEVDAMVFARCGVPAARTFLVSSRGGVRGLHKKYTRSLAQVIGDVPLVFPPLPLLPADEARVGTGAGSKCAAGMLADDTYSDFNFWRRPASVVLP